MFRLAAMSLFTTLLTAAEFQSGQAARLVLEQSSFSSHDPGIHASSLSYMSNRLLATEPISLQRYRLLVFDLSKLPSPKGDLAAQNGACPVCGFKPYEEMVLQVPPDSPAEAYRGNVTAVADAAHHSVLIWRDGRGRNQDPDVVLDESNPSGLVEPVSVALDGSRLFVGDAARHRVFVWDALPSRGDQPADAVLGSSAISPNDTLGPDSLRRPAALVSDGTNLFVSDPGSSRILVFTTGDVQLPANAVVNAASLSPDLLAPGTLIDIEGTHLSDSTESAPDDSGESLPRTLAGTEVFLNGAPLPILSVSASRIKAQLPFDVTEPSASLYIRSQRPDGSLSVTNAAIIKLTTVAPGLFAFAGKEPRGGMVLHQGASPITSESPASAGEQITVWATGLGAVTTSAPVEAGKPFKGQESGVLTPISVVVDGQPAQVVSAGLVPDAIGIYEIRLLLPDTIHDRPAARLAVIQGGYVSNTVTFPVRKTID